MNVIFIYFVQKLSPRNMKSSYNYTKLVQIPQEFDHIAPGPAHGWCRFYIFFKKNGYLIMVRKYPKIWIIINIMMTSGGEGGTKMRQSKILVFQLWNQYFLFKWNMFQSKTSIRWGSVEFQILGRQVRSIFQTKWWH